MGGSIMAFGPVEANAAEQLERCLDAAGPGAQGVLCADHHKGYSMPIGGVLASDSVIMPAGVGYDIACGNCAVRTNIQAKDVNIARVMDEVWNVLSFGVGRKNTERIDDHPVFDQIAASPVPMQRGLLQMAQQQLGTVGSGNHYVDLFEDRGDGALWVGVHFGSRGFGHKTATHFLNEAAKALGTTYRDDMDAAPATIAIGTALADDYLAAMEIAGAYAYAGRDWVVNRVMQILGAKRDPRFHLTLPSHNGYVHNHHNFAWREEHNGSWLWVVRKGATPAFPGQLGFVGGSMGDDAVIIRGRDSETSAKALYSTVHGAGRVMGRREATGKIDRKTGEVKRAGKVDWPAWQAKLKAQGVELRGGGADESPECYKRLPEVLAHHGDTIEVLHTLRPIGVAMAGLDTHDPYKD